tara:strand:+ start:2867 stop:3103 length:237 start_codon:yes stop_codon:yes gene_type:complete
MAYDIDDIDKVLNFSSWSTKRKVDELLHMDSLMYCNLGTDSTAEERKEVKGYSKKIYRAIKTIDSHTGACLLADVDKT